MQLTENGCLLWPFPENFHKTSVENHCGCRQTRSAQISTGVTVYNHIRYFKVERNFFEKVHRNEITLKWDGKNYCDTWNIENLSISGIKTTTIFYLLRKTKEAHWSCIDYRCIKIISKTYIKMVLIIHPLELHQNSMSKWCGNSLILTCRRNFDILIQHVESIGVTEQFGFIVNQKLSLLQS